MKKYARIISLIIAFMMLFSFTACGGSDNGVSDDSEVVMSYGDYTLTEKDFMYIISSLKSQMLTDLANYGITLDEAELLNMQFTEDKTLGEYIKDSAIKCAQEILIFEQICADSGITITDQEDIDAINNALADMEIAYGGEDLFEIELVRAGISRSAIERYMRADIYYNLIHEHRYGENGMAAIPDEHIYEYFLDNYYRYDGALYEYRDYTSNEPFTFEFEEEQIKAYFDTEFVKVRHILYKTIGSNNQKLSDEEIANKKDKAETTLTAIQSGEKTLDDFKNETDDSGYEYVFTYGEMVDEFEDASFEMAVGDVRLVETQYGFHIIEKLEKTDEDYAGTTDENGKTKGGYKDAVISAMSSKQIRDEAMDVLSKLNSGEIDKYPEETDAKKYYVSLSPSLMHKDSTSSDTIVKEFIKAVTEAEEGKFVEKEFANVGTYIIRRLPITNEDITADIYTAINDELAMSAFDEYVESFYDKITVNQELLDKFDVMTVPIFDSDLYIVD